MDLAKGLQGRLIFQFFVSRFLRESLRILLCLASKSQQIALQRKKRNPQQSKKKTRHLKPKKTQRNKNHITNFQKSNNWPKTWKSYQKTFPLNFQCEPENLLPHTCKKKPNKFVYRKEAYLNLLIVIVFLIYFPVAALFPIPSNFHSKICKRDFGAISV